MKYLLLLLLLYIPNSVFGQGLLDNLFRDEEREMVLEDSIRILLDDIYFAIDLIEYLEFQKDSLQNLYELEKKNIKVRTVTEEVLVTQVIRDTLTITQGGFDVNKIYKIDFNGVTYKNGSVLKVNGFTEFRWDFGTNEPLPPTTTITDFGLNLNVVTDLVPFGNEYRIITTPNTPEIRITENVGNVLTEGDYIKRVPTKLGIGLVGGFGFSYQGLTPYGGVGITYSFYDIGRLFRKSKN